MHSLFNQITVQSCTYLFRHLIIFKGQVIESWDIYQDVFQFNAVILNSLMQRLHIGEFIKLLSVIAYAI